MFKYGCKGNEVCRYEDPAAARFSKPTLVFKKAIKTYKVLKTLQVGHEQKINIYIYKIFRKKIV